MSHRVVLRKLVIVACSTEVSDEDDGVDPALHGVEGVVGGLAGPPAGEVVEQAIKRMTDSEAAQDAAYRAAKYSREAIGSREALPKADPPLGSGRRPYWATGPLGDNVPPPPTPIPVWPEGSDIPPPPPPPVPARSAMPPQAAPAAPVPGPPPAPKFKQPPKCVTAMEQLTAAQEAHQRALAALAMAQEAVRQHPSPSNAYPASHPPAPQAATGIEQQGIDQQKGGGKGIEQQGQGAAQEAAKGKGKGKGGIDLAYEDTEPEYRARERRPAFTTDPTWCHPRGMHPGGFKVIVGDLPSNMDRRRFAEWCREDRETALTFAANTDLNISSGADSGCCQAFVTFHTAAEARAFVWAIRWWWWWVPTSVDLRGWRSLTITWGS